MPEHFWGDYYSIDRGDSLETFFTKDGIKNKHTTGGCVDYVFTDKTDALGRYDAKVLFHNTLSDCYQCFDLLYRTPNILQYKMSTCVSSSKPTLADVCNTIDPQLEHLTMFKKTTEIVNCKTTFEGMFHFSYEVDYGGGGICDSPRSSIIACQEPGSPYVDNQVFFMNYGKCPAIGSSKNKYIKYQCLGQWIDKAGKVWAAVADLGTDIYRERFKCLLTRYNQQRSDNKRRWVMSRFATCSSLKNAYDGDIRLILLPAVYGTQLVEPACNLPRNFTGTWYTRGEFDTHVQINSTHIYFKTKLDEFTYKETYFTCQQNRDSRYLLSVVTVGKCEVDYVCMDMMPRHHNIIRWRMGRPYRQVPGEQALPNFLHKKFRQACAWSSFTIDRNNTAWKYKTFILDPPAPIDCPLGGRYSFVQTGAIEEQYYTRIRGITQRPRHQIGCLSYTTEFKSCTDNPKKVYIDAEYCSTVDHTARPIGEYDEPDRELTCVGYWMEDMRSYLITYDEEDPVTKFRCWVYERLDWRVMVISRSTTAACGVDQTAKSFRYEEGASLFLQLQESERDYDDCPQRYDTGADPYIKQAKIFVMAAADRHSAPLLGSLCLLSLVIYLS
ncbi:hypothetical protein NP493_335g04014 [Ridgeia piscesae]|uniref:Uncharacterized protein n=1 Tax=Ridgeia piscesae TaxID=27915 RepID=A0AAD9L541_RIDPI|nr:hypothetical protein NP493_335g04014 [Ridgeia piscesae]